MGEVGDAKIAGLDKLGEEELFEKIANGMSVKDVIKEADVGWRLWYRWLDSAQGRRQRYMEAMEMAGHYYAARAIETAQGATPATVNVDRLKVESDKWYAAKMNQQYDTRVRDVAVNISVTDLHAQAAALLASVQAGDDIIEGEWSEDEDEWGEDDV